MTSKLLHVLAATALCLLAACTSPLAEQGSEDDDDTAPDTVAIVHSGTFRSPYSVAEAQTVAAAQEVWTEGYIVGCVKGSMTTGCCFEGGARATSTSNILLADTFPATPAQCIPVELKKSADREELNIYDNAANLHRRVLLCGDLTLYFSVVGIRNIADWCFADEAQSGGDDEGDEGNGGGEGGDEHPSDDSIPDNSISHPLSASWAYDFAGKRTYAESIDAEPYLFVGGYIVGFVRGGEARIFTPDTQDQMRCNVTNNVILADSVGEGQKLIVVDIAQSEYNVGMDNGEYHKPLNLRDNPGNLFKHLTVRTFWPWWDAGNALVRCPATSGRNVSELYRIE